MKRVILNLHPSLIVPDNVEPVHLTQKIVQTIMKMNGVELVVIGRSAVEPAHENLCRVGDHRFYVPRDFSGARPLPTICPDHARAEYDATVREFHRPPFEEVTKLTGLVPRIWYTGGGTNTIVIPLTEPPTGTDWSAPCYVGLVEDHDDQGWYGSVGYYATEDHRYVGDEMTVVYTGDDPQAPEQWAQQIAAHYQSLPGASRGRARTRAASQEEPATQGPACES